MKLSWPRKSESFVEAAGKPPIKKLLKRPSKVRSEEEEIKS